MYSEFVLVQIIHRNGSLKCIINLHFLTVSRIDKSVWRNAISST